MAAARRGDDRAFDELYSRYGRRIVSYVFGMLGDHARAEDVAQEVFISALRRMRATERPIAFKPWLYEIARNACIDEFRRTRRAQEVPLGANDEDGPERRLESRTGSAHSALERRQQLDDLRGAFRGLSESHHKIIVLRELEGLSYTEIGRRMGMSRSVVESTLFRARRRLGIEYEEIASGRRCEHVHAVIEAGGTKAVRALGIRERRRVARHVAHCQPCRRYAHLAGVGDSVLKAPGLVEKIAALVPIPAFMRWRRGAADEKVATSSAPHSARVVHSIPTAAQLGDPASPVLGLGRVAAAVVAAVVAGGGVAGTLISVGGAAPRAQRPVAARVSSAPGPTSGGTPARPVLASPPRPTTPAKVAPATSGGSRSATANSERSTRSTSSSAPRSSQTASQPHTAPAAASSKQTTSTSQTSTSQSSSAPAPSSSFSSLLPQLSSGQSGPTLPQVPQIHTSQLPQPSNLNLPSAPSTGSVVGTVHKLLP